MKTKSGAILTTMSVLALSSCYDETSKFAPAELDLKATAINVEVYSETWAGVRYYLDTDGNKQTAEYVGNIRKPRNAVARLATGKNDRATLPTRTIREWLQYTTLERVGYSRD